MRWFPRGSSTSVAVEVVREIPGHAGKVVVRRLDGRGTRTVRRSTLAPDVVAAEREDVFCTESVEWVPPAALRAAAVQTEPSPERRATLKDAYALWNRMVAWREPLIIAAPAWAEHKRAVEALGKGPPSVQKSPEFSVKNSGRGEGADDRPATWFAVGEWGPDDPVPGPCRKYVRRELARKQFTAEAGPGTRLKLWAGDLVFAQRDDGRLALVPCSTLQEPSRWKVV